MCVQVTYVCVCVCVQVTRVCVGDTCVGSICVCAGAVGGICALANVLGEEVCDLYDMYKKGDIQSATNLQRRLIAPNTAVSIDSCC